MEIQPEAISKMRSVELLNMVRALPPATQAVFNLYVTEGYNHKEIGKLMNISEGTSKSQLSRAKQILQDLVKTFIEKRKETPK